MKKRVTVIGGGVTGLAAAHRLTELVRERGLDLEVVLLESSGRTGGAISTIEKGGFLIEEGPDMFITVKPWAFNLCRRLGIEGEIIGTEERKRRTYVLRNDNLTELPDGFMMLAPARVMPFLASPLFSLRGKLRIMMDLVIPKKAPGDESVASFVRRRLGKEALTRIAQPMVGGIYTGDPEKLSIMATMPRFPEMEERYGSLIKGMMRMRKARGEGRESGARYGMFVSFKRGMRTLTDALVSALPPGAVKLNERVWEITHAQERYTITTSNGVCESDGVLIAAPSYAAADFIDSIDGGAAALLRTIEYASSAVVILVYKKEDIGRSPDGFGFVVPATEKKSFIACAFASEKFPGRAPGDYTIMRVFAGGVLDPGILEREDDYIIDKVKSELGPLLELRAEPVIRMIKRYPRSMPQYLVGHTELVEKIAVRIKKLKGLELAGSAYEGVGIPDCIVSGERAAERIIKSLF